jgi:hypothetical protein
LHRPAHEGEAGVAGRAVTLEKQAGRLDRTHYCESRRIRRRTSNNTSSNDRQSLGAEIEVKGRSSVAELQGVDPGSRTSCESDGRAAQRPKSGGSCRHQIGPITSVVPVAGTHGNPS